MMKKLFQSIGINPLIKLGPNTSQQKFVHLEDLNDKDNDILKR